MHATQNSMGKPAQAVGQPFIQAPVIHDHADYGSVNGPQLMVSEIRTNAVLNLFKLMVAKGK